MSALDEHLKKHRKKLIDREEKNFRELLSAYQEIENELADAYDDLQRQIADAQAAGEEISPSWFYREKRLKKLLAQVSEQIARFGEKAAKIIEHEQRAAIKIAVIQAEETFKLLTENAPDAPGFVNLNPRAVETAVGMMGDGSPIREYFEQQLAPVVADKIKSEVIRAAAIGTDFKTVAKRLRETGDITRHRALSTARTEVNRVRRETTRAVYEENDDIIEGWEWVAAKSSRTCPLCLAMDGRQFQLDQPFPQHINCRCTMIPVIIGLPRRQRTIGKDWFENQDDKTKAAILGKETFAAYKEHGLTLDDFVAFRNNKRFGKSVTRKPLAKILADKGFDKPTGGAKFEEVLLPENIKVNFGYGTKTRLKRLLGRNISDNELGALVGGLSNAEVNVKRHDEIAGGLFFEITHPFVQTQQRSLGVDYQNRLYFHNDYFRAAKNAPKGTGLRSFVTQTAAAKKFGVQYIHTYAAGYFGHPSFNGYYTWARMGYNARLSKRDKAKLAREFADVKDLNELMAAGGKDEWKRVGTGRDMIFDLSDDAASWTVLQNYLRERKFVVKF